MKVPSPVTQHWMLERLTASLSPASIGFLKELAKMAMQYGNSLHLVGGSVRDLLLGNAIHDFDLVLEGDAIILGRSLASHFGGKSTEHTSFHTAVWRLSSETLEKLKIPNEERKAFREIDLITARAESYKTPAALPTVRMGCIEDDLRRRDFTINSLALRLDGSSFGKLLDPMNGLDDLRNGQIRVLHPQSFTDDPTRLFRAVRYAERYSFSISPETAILIPAALPGIDLLSPQRVRHELDLILDEKHYPMMIRQLAELGILELIHPALGWNAEIEKRLDAFSQENKLQDSPLPMRTAAWVLWLLDRTDTELSEIDQRLHFDSRLRKVIESSVKLVRDLEVLVGMKPSECTAFLERLPLQSILLVSKILPESASQGILSNYITTWRWIKPGISGKNLLDRGVKQGPAYQLILDRIRNAWLDGEIASNAEELELLEHLLLLEFSSTGNPDG